MESTDLNILYVEDEARSRKVMRMLASELGDVTLHIFEDSQDFLARAEAIQPRPTLVFLDVHVKPLDGFAMLKALRNSPFFRNVPIAAMTASVMNEEIEQLRVAGFNGCLAKPIDLESFSDVVARLLRGEAVWRILGH